MVAIIGILCLLLVWQILKIILKKGIINKNITDYTLEYIVSIGETGYIGTIQNENGDYIIAPID